MMRSRFVLVAALTLAACASDDGAGEPTDDSSSISINTTTTVASTSTTGPSAPPSTSASPETASSPPSTSVVVTTTASTTLTTTPPTTTTVPPRVGDPVVSSEAIGEFRQPVDLAVRPGDDRWYIVEQPGRVVRYDGTDALTVLDIGNRISTSNEQGLLGLAFAPDGTRAYVDFTESSGDTVIAEYQVDPDGVFDPATERLLLTVDQPFANHNAGDLEFGPDGMLFITLGDGGSGGDPERNGSDPSTLLGSLLRIDTTPTADAPYTIPPDNPFANGEGGAPEVWSYGLRNPWKIAFDPVTGQLWIPDVGQNEFEEINVVGPVDGATAGRGVDFGWSAYEGNERFNRDVDDPGTLTPPVLTYGRSDGCSISGGVPYRGTAIAELAPAFLYSDYCTGTIWALDLAGGRNLTLLTGFSDVAAIRTGPDGEAYVLERGGEVHRLIQG